MERRKFGRANEHVSLLGLGGFHLLEIPMREVERLVAGCPYGLPIYEKLRMAHYKLSGTEGMF